MNAPPPTDRSHTYELSRSDLFSSYLSTWSGNRLLLWLLVILFVLTTIEAYVETEASETWLLDFTIRAAALNFSAFCGVAAFQLIIAFLGAYGKVTPGLLGVHTLVLSQSGITEKTNFNESFTTWKGIHRIRETSRYLYVFLGDELFYQIPKSSFASAEEMTSFLNELRLRMDTAKLQN